MSPHFLSEAGDTGDVWPLSRGHEVSGHPAPAPPRVSQFVSDDTRGAVSITNDATRGSVSASIRMEMILELGDKQSNCTISALSG